MGWSSTGGWTFSSGKIFTDGVSTSSLVTLYYTGTQLFNSSKNYQFTTRVSGLGSATGSSFSVTNGWGDTIEYYDMSLLYTNPNLQFFSKPPQNLITNSYMIFTASGYFGTQSGSVGIFSNLYIYEIEFDIQGYSVQSNGDPNGWTYDNNYYYWYQTNGTESPIGGSTNISDPMYSDNNYLGKKPGLEEFNLSFNYYSPSGLTMSLYVGDGYPESDTNSPNYGYKISTFTSSSDYSFYGLVGSCFYFVGSTVSSVVVNYGRIGEVQVEGGYHTGNNEIYHLINNEVVDFPTSATTSTLVISDQTIHDDGVNIFGPTGSEFQFFTSQLGTVSNLSQLTSKLGNGEFVSGVWENGVWNDGWRVDENIYDFDDIIYSIPIKKDSKWRIQISGPTSSLVNFAVGDKVAIGNIVAININEERKLLRDSYIITYVDSTNVLVELYATFPFRRIEKDSVNHKIKITKNVWLNGAFLNGYFEGLWNNGLFKGYPYITEMYNTSWIDGTFDGGHFNSRFPRGTFSSTFIKYTGGSPIDAKLGLTFSYSPHGLLIGDQIEITKTDKTINPLYDGITTILEIGDYWVITDKKYGVNSSNESGDFRRITADGLIQNFKFYDNNVSLNPTYSGIKTSIVKEKKFLYNSWIDVNYSTQSSSTVNKSQIKYQLTKGGEYSDVNLYGYVTNDILSSVSSFRDSYSYDKQIYTLGTKYKIFEDFIGDSSEFMEPFGTKTSEGGLDNFYDNGWEYTLSTTYSIATFSRTSNEELEIKFGKLSSPLSPGNNIILNNSNVIISKKRYSLIEFDLIANVSLSAISLLNEILYSPIDINVNHLQTLNTKKYEYFFNRGKLSLMLKALDPGYTDTILDNIKFYEIDMIPFFQYTTYDYVNSSVQIPYIGVAPFIDYNNDNFSFVYNVSIGL